MWMQTPDDPDVAMVNLNEFHHLKVECLEDNLYALLIYACENECCGFAILKKSSDPKTLESVRQGIYSCVDRKSNCIPRYFTMAPTLQ